MCGRSAGRGGGGGEGENWRVGSEICTGWRLDLPEVGSRSAVGKAGEGCLEGLRRKLARVGDCLVEVDSHRRRQRLRVVYSEAR